jgi:hypothetical protein
VSDSRSGRALTHQQSENTERAPHNRGQGAQVDAKAPKRLLYKQVSMELPEKEYSRSERNKGEVYFGHEIGGDIWVITVQGRGYDSQFYWNGRRDTGLPPQTWVFEGAGVGRPPAPTVTVAGRDDASGGLYDGESGFDDTTSGRYDSGYGSSRQDKCDAGHPLITGGSVGQYFQDQAQCDSCRDAISAHDAHSCRECQFDLCSHCGRASRRAGRGYGGGGGGNTEGLLGGGNGGESGCPCLIM